MLDVLHTIMRRGGIVLLLLPGRIVHEHGQHMVPDQVFGDVGLIHGACMVYMQLTHVLHPACERLRVKRRPKGWDTKRRSENSLLFTVIQDLRVEERGIDL